jgi:UDP-N-acetyl-D-mannosaminuronic acid dehydrogenase
MTFKTVSIIGLGYIGLPTAALFASRKIKVIGVDVNQDVVDKINQGKIHIIEPELDIAVHSAVKEGYLKATMDPEPADAFLITVPTPFKENHKPDLSYIKSATKSIAPLLQKGNLIILESTSPIGTTEKIAQWINEERPELIVPDINISHCPERVLPGHIMRELIENDRVIGGLTKQCAERSIELYKTFLEGECFVTDARTAELSKLTENSFRDVNIAFANELSLICDKHKIDVWELIALANRHPRVNILQPGPGVGGHCIAVDPWFIVDSAPEQSQLIATARKVNDNKPEWVVKKVFEEIERNKINNPTIACLGLSYKPDIDDTRESPAVDIVKKLLVENIGRVVVIEPNIEALPDEFNHLNNICHSKDIDDGVNRCDIILVLVNHKEFKNYDWNACDNKIVINMVAGNVP